MESGLPNQHLADRIAGLVNERGESLVESNDEKVIVKSTFEPKVEPKSVSVKVATKKVAVNSKTGKILYELDSNEKPVKKQNK